MSGVGQAGKCLRNGTPPIGFIAWQTQVSIQSRNYWSELALDVYAQKETPLQPFRVPTSTLNHCHLRFVYEHMRISVLELKADHSQDYIR